MTDVYRALAYVERCACNEPATAGCTSCGRARCSFHLTRGMCARCTEAIRREMVKHDSVRFAASMTLGVMLALIMLVFHSAAGLALGIPVAAGAFFALRTLQYRTCVKRMGPSLSALKGELPPPPQEPVGTEPAQLGTITPGGFEGG